MHLTLLSPYNFLLGCVLSLQAATHQASPEPAEPQPWPFFRALVALVFLLATLRLLAPAAGWLMPGLARIVSPRSSAILAGLVVTLATLAMAAYLLRRFGRFYVRMCLVGLAHRQARL